MFGFAIILLDLQRRPDDSYVLIDPINCSSSDPGNNYLSVFSSEFGSIFSVVNRMRRMGSTEFSTL